MIVKKIVQIGNPILSRKSELVAKINSEKTQRVVADLIDSMRHHNLIGMAAVQIGEKLNIFVTEVRKRKYRNFKTDKLRIFINPEIIWSSKKEVVMYEGCGSIIYAKLFAPVSRPEKIIIRAFNEKGKQFELKADGMLARVIQHEHDHLNGIKFIEKITDLKKIMGFEEYEKMLSLKNR